MTLDEAIKHAEEIAEEQESRGYCDRSVCVIMDENNHNCDECEVVKCRECAKEHHKLAEWLKDYKRLLEQQPCEDCISRQQAIDKMQELEEEDIEAYGCSIPEGFDGKRAIEALKSLSSVHPKPKTGHWELVQYDGNPNIGNWHCSECNRIVCGAITAVNPVYAYKYFPNCGAKMQEMEI